MSIIKCNYVLLSRPLNERLREKAEKFVTKKVFDFIQLLINIIKVQNPIKVLKNPVTPVPPMGLVEPVTKKAARILGMLRRVFGKNYEYKIIKYAGYGDFAIAIAMMWAITLKLIKDAAKKPSSQKKFL